MDESAYLSRCQRPAQRFRVKEEIQAGHGQAALGTVSGGTLIAAMPGKSMVSRDEKGGTSTVTIPNLFQSNGVIQVVDAVLMPN